MDVAAERRRLGRDREAAAKLQAQAQGKLANADFLAKAPEAVVAKVQAQLARAPRQTCAGSTPPWRRSRPASGGPPAHQREPLLAFVSFAD